MKKRESVNSPVAPPSDVDVNGNPGTLKTAGGQAWHLPWSSLLKARHRCQPRTPSNAYTHTIRTLTTPSTEPQSNARLVVFLSTMFNMFRGFLLRYASRHQIFHRDERCDRVQHPRSIFAARHNHVEGVHAGRDGAGVEAQRGGQAPGVPAHPGSNLSGRSLLLASGSLLRQRRWCS